MLQFKAKRGLRLQVFRTGSLITYKVYEKAVMWCQFMWA